MDHQSAARWNRIAVISLIALAALCIAWELRLAPLRPGGSWVALKAFPLFLALPGLLRARRYTHQWACLLALAYLAEGLVRAPADHGLPAILAGIEAAVAAVFFFACAFFARATQPSKLGVTGPNPATNPPPSNT
jgi:uncharacterized membrane protein